MKCPKISIIVPVYNEAKHIKECLLSLFSQTLQDIEFIFVNDNSSDNSIDIIKETASHFPNRVQSIKIINHTSNRGVAAVRNTGLINSTGEYIGWCDADDWVDKNMYEILYNKAISTDSDLVWCDYYCVENENTNLKRQYAIEDKVDCIKDILFSRGNLKTCLWSRLIKRSVFLNNDIYFKEGCNIGEDTIGTILGYAYSTKVAYVDKGLYFYRFDSSTSISSVKRKEDVEKSIKEINNNIKIVINRLEQLVIKDTIKDALIVAKINVKTSELYLNGIKEWSNIYNELKEEDLKKFLPRYEFINWKLLSMNIKILYLLIKLCKNIKGYITGFRIR